jgi:hypothetical protein
MLVPLLVLLQEVTSVDVAMANYREQTRAEKPCRQAEGDAEVVVCARREADRYRVPLVSSYSGSDLPDARVKRLVGQRIEPECGQGAFMARCGAVSVGVSVGPGGARYVQRPLAP